MATGFRETDISNLEFLARVARLYYEDGLTQERISQEIGYSRSAVSRFLTEARRTGVVEIRINHPLRRNDLAEQQLGGLFELRTIRVLSRGALSYERMLRRLGSLGAQLTEELLVDGMTVGVSWGTAVFEVGNALHRQQLPNVTVVQLLGALGTPDPQIDGSDLVRSYAHTLGGRYRILPAPAIVDNREIRDSLLRGQPIRRTLQMGSEADLAIVGIGTTAPAMSSLVRAEYLSKTEVKEIAASGAVGDICALHFDEEGNVLDIPIAHRVVGIEPNQLRNIDFVLGVAGGEVKAPAILGALRSGLLDALMTDDIAARVILHDLLEYDSTAEEQN